MTMTGSDLFQFEENIVKEMLKQFVRNEEYIEEDVQNLKQWMKTQPHLPEILDNNRILNFLLLNKCSVEKTKQKIDMYYTIRSIIPELYENANPKLLIMKQLWETFYWIPVPQMTKEMYRVFIFKLRNKDLIDRVHPYHTLTHIFNVHEMRMKEDRMFGDVIFCDLKDMPWTYLMKFTPTVIAKIVANYEKVFSMRMKACYFVNAHPSFGTILAIAKAVLKPKMFERVHVREDSGLLFDILPKEAIPSDYGGSGKSCEEIHELVSKKLNEYQQRFDELGEMKIDEKLRPEKLQNDDILGFHGNFKKLDFD